MAARCVRQHCTSRAAVVKSVFAELSEAWASGNSGSVIPEHRILGGSSTWRRGEACVPTRENGLRARQCKSPSYGGISVDAPAMFGLVTTGRACPALYSARDFRSGVVDQLEAIQFSTFSVEERNFNETLSTESAASIEPVATENESLSEEFVPEIMETPCTENESLSEEFVPEIMETPCTPLVEAIQAQEFNPVEESSEPLKSVLSDIAPSRQPIPPPPDRDIIPTRIYVGGLPFSAKAGDLKEALVALFAKHGTVLALNIAQHRHQTFGSMDAGKHRGYAFVTMETPEQAKEAIEKLNAVEVMGRFIVVSQGLKPVQPEAPSVFNGAGRVPRRKLYVGNLAESTNRTDLSDRFSEFGAVVDVKLITELQTGRSRGFGFVTFEEEDQAMKAILELDGAILNGSVITVNIAKYPQDN